MENTVIAASPLDIPVMRHTPGPWHWESDAVKNDPTGRVRYQVTAIGKTITQVYYSSFEGGPTNAEADARLIAAAPDLLAALNAVMYWDNGKPEWDDARAAIARAVGHNAMYTARRVGMTEGLARDKEIYANN